MKKILFICGILIFNAISVLATNFNYTDQGQIVIGNADYYNDMENNYYIDLGDNKNIIFDCVIDLEGWGYDYVQIFDVHSDGSETKILDVGYDYTYEEGVMYGRIKTTSKSGKARIYFHTDASVSGEDDYDYEGFVIAFGSINYMRSIQMGLTGEPRGLLDLGTELGVGQGLRIGDYVEINEREGVDNSSVIGFNAVLDTDGTCYNGDCSIVKANRFSPKYYGASWASGMILRMTSGGKGDLEFMGINWNSSNTKRSLSEFTRVLNLNTDGRVGIGIVPSTGSGFEVGGTTQFHDDITVGTSSADKDVVVYGKVSAKEIKVTSQPGADFVFGDDYELRSLEDVETFIEANKHLPEVPSAEVMESDGMSVSAMNQLLLQKVEELTLYLIELKKENKVLSKQVEGLLQE